LSKFDLRDISERLTRSRDTEAVVFEFLGYLQAMRPDWRAALAFYEVSRDVLVGVYQRDGTRLKRRDISLAVDQLPSRLVRKFFHPSAFFNRSDRRSLLSHLFQSSPYYEPDPLEAPSLRLLTPIASWQSCVCLPLADQEDVLALLVLASEKKGAFGSKAVGDIIPVKSLAALALAQHLYRHARPQNGVASDRTMSQAAAEFQERIRQLNVQSEELREDNQIKARKVEALTQQIEQLDKNSSEYRHELDRVKNTLFALEEQSAAATQHLSEAYSQLTQAQSRLVATQRTVEFLKEVFQVLSQEHDEEDFSRTMVSWFCEHFGIERCSLMVLDRAGETLEIAAQRGIDPAVAGKVRVRIGQGIAGWVAHNRKPLFVRVREDAEVKPTGQDAYNSDSFISVPLVHNNKLSGVLNLSNRADHEAFDEMDFDRAVLAGALLAMILSSRERARRAAAWS
jgi:signal transduction protein with GAF and PtsI domain